VPEDPSQALSKSCDVPGHELHRAALRKSTAHTGAAVRCPGSRTFPVPRSQVSNKKKIRITAPARRWSGARFVPRIEILFSLLVLSARGPRDESIWKGSGRAGSVYIHYSSSIYTRRSVYIHTQLLKVLRKNKSESRKGALLLLGKRASQKPGEKRSLEASPPMDLLSCDGTGTRCYSAAGSSAQYYCYKLNSLLGPCSVTYKTVFTTSVFVAVSLRRYTPARHGPPVGVSLSSGRPLHCPGSAAGHDPRVSCIITNGRLVRDLLDRWIGFGVDAKQARLEERERGTGGYRQTTHRGPARR
jgi:hypothetical protein